MTNNDRDDRDDRERQYSDADDSEETDEESPIEELDETPLDEVDDDPPAGRMDEDRPTSGRDDDRTAERMTGDHPTDEATDNVAGEAGRSERSVGASGTDEGIGTDDRNTDDVETGERGTETYDEDTSGMDETPPAGSAGPRGTADTGDTGRRTIRDDDEGKPVFNERGERVGIVAEVQHDTAHVDPNPGLAEQIKAKLGWADIDDDTYPLQEQTIERISEDGIHLRGDL